MKVAVALIALLISACAEFPAEPPITESPITEPPGTEPPPVAAPPVEQACAATRPTFGVAGEAERELFAYDVNAALNLQKSNVSTHNGLEASSISFSSPGGGVVTGLMFAPVSRSGVRRGSVLMAGLPGRESLWA